MPVGECLPDPTEGITDASQLPAPIVEYRERSVNDGRKGAVDLGSSVAGGAHVSESAVA